MRSYGIVIMNLLTTIQLVDDACARLYAAARHHAHRSLQGDAFFFIMAEGQSSGCIEPENGSVETGNSVILGDCSDDLNTWRKEEPSENATLRFHSRRDDTKCLQATHTGALVDGAKMRIYPCTDSALQYFLWSGDEIMPVNDPTLCVVYQGTSFDINLSDIIFLDCANVNAQEEDFGIEKGWKQVFVNGAPTTAAGPGATTTIGPRATISAETDATTTAENVTTTTGSSGGDGLGRDDAPSDDDPGDDDSDDDLGRDEHTSDDPESDKAGSKRSTSYSGRKKSKSTKSGDNEGGSRRSKGSKSTKRGYDDVDPYLH